MLTNKGPDKISKATRSKIMSCIRKTGNKTTEKRLRVALMRNVIRGWRVRSSNLIGNPDFVFQKSRLVVFVDGCFWHKCPKCFRRPFSSRSYWDKKIIQNRMRDIKINRVLTKESWRIVRLWECELKSSLERCINKIITLRNES